MLKGISQQIDRGEKALVMGFKASGRLAEAALRLMRI
jgi:hypothetical protein